MAKQQVNLQRRIKAKQAADAKAKEQAKWIGNIPVSATKYVKPQKEAKAPPAPVNIHLKPEEIVLKKGKKTRSRHTTIKAKVAVLQGKIPQQVEVEKKKRVPKKETVTELKAKPSAEKRKRDDAMDEDRPAKKSKVNFACHNCGNKGHKAADCSEEADESTKKCYLCSKTGHMGKSCPWTDKVPAKTCYKFLQGKCTATACKMGHPADVRALINGEKSVAGKKKKA